MLAAIGAIALTLIAIFLVCNFIYLPLMAIGFGGSKGNWPFLIGGLVLSAGVVAGWWYLVGTNIHVSFG